MGRVYLAILQGGMRSDEGDVDAPIGRHPTDRKRMAIVRGGREAQTHYRVLARLRGRGTEAEEKIQKRLHNARQEVKYLPRYDYCIVNDDLDEAWRELRGIVRAERLSTKRFLPELD